MSIGEYCNRDVAIVTAQETVQDAAKVMRAQHVGDVVVVERRGGLSVPVGILTDRDIVIELIAREVELDKIIIGDVMTRNLLTARESDSLSTVLSQMRGRGVRRVPVVNEQGGLEGIFSLDDLLELLAEQMHDFVAVLRKEANQEQRLRT